MFKKTNSFFVLKNEVFNRFKIYWLDFTLFGLLALMLFSYTRSISFSSDEGDNILGAMHVANGLDIYKDYFSQHTPLPYYWIGFYYFLGITTIADLKLAWGVTIFSFMVCVYNRYKEDAGRLSIFFVFSYFLCTAMKSYGVALMADSLEGMALLVLVLEFLKHQNTPTEKLSSLSIVVISASIFTSVMSAFVSVYPIFVLLLGFIAGEIYSSLKIKRQWELRYYLKITVVIIAPFLLIFFWYYLTNNLHNACFQSYQFNKEIYSKYIGGFGTDWQSPFLEALRNFYLTFSATFLHIKFPGFNFLLFCFGVFPLFFIRPFLSIMFIIFYSYLCMRGIEGFHSVKTYWISPLIFCFGISQFIKKSRYFGKKENPWIFQNKLTTASVRYNELIYFVIVLSFSIIILGNPEKRERFFDAFSHFRDPLWVSPSDILINALVSPNETIWQGGVDAYVYVRTNHLPASRIAGLVPWFYEAYETILLKDLRENKPKLILYEPMGNIWGYVHSRYAKKLTNFIENNYVLIEKGIYLEKSAYSRTDMTRYDQSMKYQPSAQLSTSTPIKLFLNPKHQKQGVELKRIGIAIGTYARRNAGAAELRLRGPNGANFSQRFLLSELIDNQYKYFNLNSKYYNQGELISLSGKGISTWESHDKQGSTLTCIVYNYINDKTNFTPGCF